MIGPTGVVLVLVATKPLDSHNGAEGILALVVKTINGNSFDAAIKVFRAK